MSPVGAIFVPSPLKTGTNLLHPLPPQSLNGSVAYDQQHSVGEKSTVKLYTCIDRNRHVDTTLKQRQNAHEEHGYNSVMLYSLIEGSIRTFSVVSLQLKTTVTYAL